MKTNNLTIKQEAFAQAYVKYGDASKAYREVYSCKNKKDKSIWECSSRLLANNKVLSRVETLMKSNAKIAQEEFNYTITDSLREDLNLIEKYKKHIAILEDPNTDPLQEIASLRTIKFIGAVGFNAAMDRVSKKLGFYEKHNEQKQQQIQTPDEVNDKLTELLSKLKK